MMAARAKRQAHTLMRCAGRPDRGVRQHPSTPHPLRPIDRGRHFMVSPATSVIAPRPAGEIVAAVSAKVAKAMGKIDAAAPAPANLSDVGWGMMSAIMNGRTQTYTTGLVEARTWRPLGHVAARARA